MASFANTLAKPGRHIEYEGDYLPYELDYIPRYFERKAKSELFEDEETRIQSLKLFRSMLKDTPDLPWYDDDLFLISFLRARKFDVKRARQLIKNFYSVRSKHFELYGKFNFEDVKRTIDPKLVGYLPCRDGEGCVVLLIRAEPWDTEVNSMGDIMRALTCALLHANLSPITQVTGFKAIVDFKGLTMTQLPHISPTYILMFSEALQSCFPGRFKAVHVINEGTIFSYIWVILKQFLTKKIKDRFHFHNKNMKKLHKYFSPSILPAEFEGELPPFDNTEWIKKMEEKADYFTTVLHIEDDKTKKNS